jgi:1-phosphofructokinase family hexose kinase
MILCIGTTPAIQRVMVFAKLELDAVNRAMETQDGFAGKSINVAKVLAHLGQRAFATGFAGGERGRELQSAVTARGIESEFVTVSPTTRQCVSLLDQSTGMVTELVEESGAVTPSDYTALEVIVNKRLSTCQAVVMSGSLTPGGPVDFYKRITRAANQHGILSMVDAQGPPLIESLEARPGLVKPNRRELAATVQRALRTEEELIAGMHEVQKRGARQVVVTAGNEPTLATDGHDLWRIHSPKIKPINPIGSGDSFTAALVWRLTQKEPLGEACRWAAAAGAANALSLMPGELNPRDVEQLAEQVKVEKL